MECGQNLPYFVVRNLAALVYTLSRREGADVGPIPLMIVTTNIQAWRNPLNYKLRQKCLLFLCIGHISEFDDRGDYTNNSFEKSTACCMFC